MPGLLPSSWRQGNRSEYLAQYFLSALGVSTPVLRQEDIGVDFYCALAKEQERHLTFHSPFAVQLGSAISKQFRYGGFDANGKWRKASFEWLFSQEVPLFIGTIDRTEARFRLYQTSPMWMLRYKFGDMSEVVLCPDTWHHPLTELRAEPSSGDGGDGMSYQVPLFNPIVDLRLPDLETEKRDAAIDAMTEAVRAEQTNITNRRLGLHFVTFFSGNESNNGRWLRTHPDGGTFWSTEIGRNVPGQLEALMNAAVVLALNYGGQANKDGIASLAPVFRLFNRSSLPPGIEELLPDEIRAVIRQQTQATSGPSFGR